MTSKSKDPKTPPQTWGAKAEAAVERLAALPPWVWRLLAMGAFSAICLKGLFDASAIIDGTRYFFLDDDQMVSMRFARNLAEGHGLVWNPGERVEGYSNLGWTLVMTLVVPATMPLAVHMSNMITGTATISTRIPVVAPMPPGTALITVAVFVARVDVTGPDDSRNEQRAHKQEVE